MSYFATAYTIHFDDTMAYGSHHFLTAFKFQCAARESLLYGDRIFDAVGVRQALEQIHLFTADAYSRNLNPAFLGDRVAILITLEEWGRVSARFCYRVVGQQGQPICAGFQTMICADAKTGQPIPLPEPLRIAFDAIREITEAEAEQSFRDRVLTSAEATQQLFTHDVCEAALAYLADRYPQPKIIASCCEAPPAIAPIESDAGALDVTSASSTAVDQHGTTEPDEVWVFPGQGSFDARLLSDRVAECCRVNAAMRQELDRCADIAEQQLGGDAAGVLSGSVERCLEAVRDTPNLSQVAIHVQSVLGARLRTQGASPAVLMGHSFGELAALNVAGCFDLPTGVWVVCQRVLAVEEFGPDDGGLLVVTSDRRTIAEEIAVSGLSRVVIAGRNHERQTVVSGPQGDLDRLRGLLQARDIQAIKIPSPTSFHHPALRAAAAAWYRRLQEIRIEPPRRIVFSPIGRRMITADDDIAGILSSQFLRPFDLQGAIDDLIAGGISKFVDCGSSGSLARLLQAAGPDSIQVAGMNEPPATESRRPSVATPVVSERVLGANAVAAHSPRTPIAIVGQGCVLPGRATSPAELYAAISTGRLGIVDQRQFDPNWEQDFFSASLVPDRSTSALAGRVDDRDIVAPEGVDSAVFREFSRAQQILCVALAPCRAALQQANRVLCLVGATADGFQDQDGFAALRYSGVDVAESQVASRVGRQRAAFQDPHTAIQEVFDRVVRLGLKVTLVDAACASSLYTVALGMQALEDDEADVVLAGGVFCPGPGNNCLFSQFGGLTSTGCRPFDAEADGVVFAEGAAMVVLQRVSAAKQSDQEILAVVRGVGLSSDGRSSSANVPQTAGQLLALQRCYANYHIAPASIAAIEAHGTSTVVGDATELNTLRQFFQDHVTAPIPVHSLKGLLGHTGWTAGAASIIAASESLRQGAFPAQAHFREPSDGLLSASEVLSVPTRPVPLLSPNARIAIDGFGFGGSNAHVVIQRYPDGDEPDVEAARDRAETPQPREQEQNDLVIVGWHRRIPTARGTSLSGHSVARFDRDKTTLPEDMLMLPDLADDIDISQTLALNIVGETLAQLAQLDDDLRQQTGIVLALRGKTERALEATTRVLKPRLLRDLAGLSATDLIEEAALAARPSGPYTLQGMMPNVAAGRTALQFDLNGPNFLVDAANRSLDAAFASARLLLRSGEQGGTKLVIVAAIQVNRWSISDSPESDTENEYAAAFAVTTRRYADELQLDVVCPFDGAFGERHTTEEQLDRLIAVIQGQAAASDENEKDSDGKDEFPLHAPVWVESDPLPVTGALESRTDERYLVIATANHRLVADLLEVLPRRSERYLVVLVGTDSANLAGQLSDPSVIAVDLDDRQAVESALDAVAEFAPDVVVALDRIATWDLEAVLERVSENQLCEFLFLAMQRLVARIRRGETEVWGLFLGGWNDVIHPATGPICGLVKSVQRELPAGRLGLLSTRVDGLADAWQGLQNERLATGHTEQEIVHDQGVRLVRRLQPTQEKPLPGQLSSPQVRLDADSVVIASGGARGVTAVAVEALLRDYGCTVVALGRSALERGPANFNAPDVEQQYYEKFLTEHPQASPAVMRKSFESAQARWEAQETVDHLSRCGGRIYYLPVDVTNRDEVEQAVNRIVDELGRVDLILHGAGVQWSKRLEDRSLAEFRSTFDVKVGGLRHLVNGCRRRLGRIVPVHVFSSAYSIFGNDGQHDYGAANETLDRLCGLTKILPDHRWSSIAWSAWDGIGMTRGSEYRALAERRNLALLGAVGGQRIFRAVLQGVTGTEINVPLSATERTRYRVRTIPAPVANSAGRIAEAAVNLAGVDCLSFHRARGVPTLPGAWIFDFMARAALRLHDKDSALVSIEDIRFYRFVRAGNEHDPHLRVIVAAKQSGYSAWLVGDVLNSDGIPLMTDVVFAEASLSMEQGSLPTGPSLNGWPGNGEAVVRLVSDPYCGADQSVQLSGPFDCLQEIEIAECGRRAIFTPDRSTRWDGVVPSLLLDASLRVAGMHVAPGLHVPTRIARAVVPIGIAADASEASGWKIRTSCPLVTGDEICCDRVEVADETGRLRLSVDGAVVTRLH